MIKRFIIGFLGVSVIAVLVALLGSESAQTADLYRCRPTAADIKDGLPTETTHCSPKLHCEYTISGQVKHGCFSADPGSELFFVELFGVPGSLVGKRCSDEDGTCLAMRCSVFGTVQLEGGGSCDPETVDPDCGIAGIAFCRNHGGNSSTAQGQPFTLETTLSETASFQGNCTKSGRCRQSLVVDATLSDDICINRNWEFLTFVASEFNGGCCTCDGGYDTDTATPGDCCATSARNLDDGSCAITGTESCNDMRCTADLSTFVPGGVNAPYVCGEIPQNP